MHFGDAMRRTLLLLSVLCLHCGDDTSAPDAGPAVDAAGDAPAADVGAADAGTDAGGPLRWDTVADPAMGPLRIWGALVADLGGAESFLFGGTTAGSLGGATLDRAYRYAWEGESLVATPVGEGTPRPAARYCGCAAYDAARDVVIVAGGRDERAFLDAPETWELDLGTDTWRQWAGSTPEATLGCMITRGPDGELYWFGGASPTGTRDVLYRAESESWVEVVVEGPKPEPRYDGVLFSDDEGLLLFAGAQSASGSFFFADVWRFAEGAWTELHDGGEIPGRRVPWFRQTADGFVFAGGYGGDMRAMAGVYRYVHGEGFEELRPEPALSERGFAASLPAPSGIGVMLGGFDGTSPVQDFRWLR